MPNDAATTRVLVWDDLDMHATLASVLVVDPPRTPEIDLEAVYLWLDRRCVGDEAPDAYLFTTVDPGHEADEVARITDIRTKGFGTIVRRGRGGDRSVTLTDLLRSHVDATLIASSVVELIVASHDGDRLAARLQDIAGGPVTVTVLGFRERALFAADNPRLKFVDLEDVPGAFDFPLPRTNLYDLTDEGRALPALRRPKGASGRTAPAIPGHVEQREDGGLPPLGEPTIPAPASEWSNRTSPSPSTMPSISSSPWTPTETSSPVPPWSTGRAIPAPPPPPPAAGIGTDASMQGYAPESAASTNAGQPGSPTSSAVGALDDLLAGVQASSLAPTPPSAPRPGRVSPPNGSVDHTVEDS